MGRRPSDPGWAIFEAEISRIPSREIASRLGISTVEVGELKRKRQRPSFADLPRFSAAMYDGDSTMLAAKMGMIPSMSGTVRDLVRARAQLALLEDQVAIARKGSADAVHTALSELMSKALLGGHWAIAIWPGIEGVAPWRLHYRDRIDLRRTDGQPLQAGETRKQFGALLDAAGAEPGVALPRWDEGPSPVPGAPAAVSHWVVPRLGRETYPTSYLPLQRVISVTVVSTTATARPDAVGAILARVFGYGYTSAQILGRRLYGGDITPELLDQRAELHRQWVAHPHDRMVWSHFGRDTKERDMLNVDGLKSMRDCAVVWLYEPDALLGQKAGREPRPHDLIAKMASSRDAVDTSLRAEHVVRVPLNPSAAPANTINANDERMHGSLRAAAEVIRQFVARRMLDEQVLTRRLTAMTSGDSDARAIADFLRTQEK